MKLGLEALKLIHVIELFKDKDIIDANVCEEKGHIVVRILMVSGNEHEVYRIGKEGIELTKTIFCPDLYEF